MVQFVQGTEVTPQSIPIILFNNIVILVAGLQHLRPPYGHTRGYQEQYRKVTGVTCAFEVPRLKGSVLRADVPSSPSGVPGLVPKLS